MRKQVNILIAAVLMCVLVITAWLVAHQERTGPTPASAVAMIRLGYTNPAVGHGRFVLLCVSNQAPPTVRLRGNWVEVEGSPFHWARTINPSLPCNIPPVLKGRASITFAVGEPTDASETRRWRFGILSTRYTWQEQWFDFSFRHKLPLKLGPIVLVDAQRVLNPSNCVTVTTEWLTK
jgi:hypothetical protein